MHPLSEGTITQTLELLHSGSADARGTVTYQGNFALRCAPKHVAREAGGFSLDDRSSDRNIPSRSHRLRKSHASKSRCGTLSETRECVLSSAPAYAHIAHTSLALHPRREHLAERQR